MRLKRLELFGFKSFADRTVLRFEHDLVGIVGPNGCGKSNVVDAVRWVLGEQRPTSMRGGEMTDVIFKGSASRPPLSVAEVTIILDNSAGTLEDREAEVGITRRVYRSGEGEYLLDGQRVRLKDVRELLFGTGLGSRGYSVLEQGKIDAILSANALERRSIFEEAAGVSRYRQRKKEAESRLKRVETDLQRVDDVTGELERRERSLKVQAGRARRFIEARDAWRVDGLRLARHQLHALDRDVAAQGRGLSELETRVEEHRRLRGSVEEDVVVREREQESVTGESERLAARAAELAGEVRAVDERRTQLLARVASWRESSDEERERARELDARHDQRRAEATRAGEELEALEAGVREAEERVRVLGRESAELTEEHRRAEVQARERNEDVLALLHDLTTQRNRAQHLEDSLAPLEERARRAQDRRDGLRAEEAEARAEEERARAEHEGLEAAGARAEEERAALEVRGRGLADELGTLEDRRSELELACARLASRIESLVDWERERERLEAGAQELLAAREKGAGPELSAELAGLLADHLRADTDWARAVDAALGERAQALVVADRQDAGVILAWLKERRRGRVSLVLPADALGDDGPAGLPSGALAAALQEDGVEGPLLDAVRPDPGHERLARALLGDVVRVRDASCALELGTRHPALRFVTAEGDLVDATGAAGGHVEVAQGAVGRRSTAADLEVERGAQEAELAGVRADLSGAREQRASIDARLVELRAEIERSLAARTRVRGALDAAGARRAELARAAEVADHECAGLDEERDGALAGLARARERLAELNERYELERRELEGLDEQRQGLEAERGQRQRDEGQARIEATGLRERLDALTERRVDVERSCEELRAELERAARLAEEHAQSADEGEAEAERLVGARDTLLQERGEVEERIAELRERERAGRDSIEVLRRRGEALTGELEELLGTVSERRLERQRLELSRDEVGRRAEEDFDRPVPELMTGFEAEEELAADGALAALQERVAELKHSMDRLGPVNLEAVEELEEVSGRLGFLLEQRQDLDVARRTLESTIQKLNAESERRFLEAFEDIRSNFHTIFRQLFGGGRADITLAEGENVLEAGIEITARPPGRESLPITLLSGGQRTLTALAILFSVFRANSSPFCILDEVDAALDDANIGRFLSLIERGLVDTQYVVVTHNKGTMAACQLLYGVTMAVRGVSHVVSVELDEVDEFVPEARGSATLRQKAPEPEPTRAPAEEARENEAPAPARAEAEAEVELIPSSAVRRV